MWIASVLVRENREIFGGTHRRQNEHKGKRGMMQLQTKECPGTRQQPEARKAGGEGGGNRLSLRASRGSVALSTPDSDFWPPELRTRCGCFKPPQLRQCYNSHRNQMQCSLKTQNPRTRSFGSHTAQPSHLTEGTPAALKEEAIWQRPLSKLEAGPEAGHVHVF